MGGSRDISESPIADSENTGPWRRCKLIPYWDNGESRWAWVPIAHARRGEVVTLEDDRPWLVTETDVLVCTDIGSACLRIEVAP